MMTESRRLPWAGIGVLVAVLAGVVALCCLCSPDKPAPPCDVPPPPVVVPAPDAAIADDAGTVDAGAPCDAAPPVVFDAGPSCGSHPWCPHPKPCCTDVLDCC
jgi:hypothetical protein